MQADCFNSSRRGFARSTLIRACVLSALFIGVVIFGWLSRPDLVRNFLGIMASAKNADQALLFANENLFSAAADLAEAQAVLGKGGRMLIEDMDAQGATEKKMSKETLNNNPENAAARILTGIEQSRRDVYRAKSLVDGPKSLSTEGKSVMFQTIDLCDQAIDSYEKLAGTKLGEELARQKTFEFLQDTSSVLKEIKKVVDAIPRRKFDESTRTVPSTPGG